MPQLTALYKINNTNLNLRKQFIRLGAEDIKTLKRLRGWSNRVADDLARQFYDHQFTFAPTLEFFTAYARKKGLPLADLRRRLEQSQSGYFKQIFEEAANGGDFGVEFFERRLFIGKLHNVINLPLKWYVGSYSFYERLVRRYLCRSFWYNPFFIYQAEKAIFAVFNYDMQAVTDAFFYDYLQSIGLNLTAVVRAAENEDLSEHYDILKSTVRETLEETIHTAGMLNEASNQLSETSKQAGAATEQIAVTVQEVAKGATQQAGAATNTVSLVSQISRAIEGVAGGAVEQAAAVDTSSRITHQLSAAIANVANNVEQIERVKSQVELSAVKVREMGKRSAQIGTIVGAIDEISSQTNLLALNAAIEAARAGEHGKGFAVVADEVRKLAERASAATREITALIQSVQQVVTEAVTAMDNSAVEVDRQVAAISGATREMNTFSKELLDAMTTVSAVVQENTAATEQMSAGSGQMLNAIEEIASVSQENSAAAEEVSAAAEEMSAQVTEVNESAQKLHQVAQKLQALVGRFELEASSSARPGHGQPPAYSRR